MQATVRKNYHENGCGSLSLKQHAVGIRQQEDMSKKIHEIFGETAP